MDTWDEFSSIVVQPFWASKYCILGSVIFFFLVNEMFRLFVSQSSISRDAKLRQTAAMRFTSMMHAILVVNILWVPDHPDCAELYSYHPARHFFFCVATGYFIWDLFDAFQKKDFIFSFHALASIWTFFFALHPFAQCIMSQFLGWFELSTPVYHAMELMRIYGWETKHPSAVRATEALFALTFLIARVVIGSFVSFTAWQRLIRLLEEETYHSLVVVYWYMLSNTFLQGLQYYWGFVIVSKAISVTRRVFENEVH